MTTASLLKYHGLGNDFLIALDPTVLSSSGGNGETSKELVRHLCDRRRGFGADGLILVRPGRGGDSVEMELRNADGGRADTSGNGLRCLALALVDAGAVSTRTVVIGTDAGPVTASVLSRRTGDCAEVTISMGHVAVGKPLALPEGVPADFEAREATVGNPHLVLLGPSLSGFDIAEVGPRLETARPGGQNVEGVAPDGDGGLDLVVWERGAGLTEACGSGSCAAAAVARAAGLVGEEVTVRNPGGALVVELTGPLEDPEATLTGPACRIGRVEVEIEPQELL